MDTELYFSDCPGFVSSDRNYCNLPFRSFGDEISVHSPDMAHLTGLDSPYIMEPNILKRIFLGTPPFR